MNINTKNLMFFIINKKHPVYKMKEFISHEITNGIILRTWEATNGIIVNDFIKLSDVPDYILYNDTNFWDDDDDIDDVHFIEDDPKDDIQFIEDDDFDDVFNMNKIINAYLIYVYEGLDKDDKYDFRDDILDYIYDEKPCKEPRVKYIMSL